MNHRIKKITAVIMAVIFLIGILPYALNRIFNRGIDSKGLQIRVAMENGKISKMPMEEYLIGVVAAEMPAEFELEALKAQAIAARTYALRKMVESRTANPTFDVDNTEKTQAWTSKQELFRKWGIVNYFKYQRKVSQAVEDTQGKVLTFGGKMIDAVYHSSCGRKSTERAADVWSGDTSYLTNVPSGEVTPLRFVNHQVFDVVTFYKMLGFNQPPSQFNEKDLIIIDRTKAGRIKTLAVRNKVIPGTEFRTKLQLPSTDFEWKIQGNKLELISYGKGHGVGMSQYGANDLAKAGKKYNEILGHYYQGTKIDKAY